MTDQLPRRRYVRHQTYARLRKTDTGRFNKFLSEQATRLGAARRAIRDLFKRVGTKSAQDIAEASTAASLGASRITGNTALRFTEVKHTNPGLVTLGLTASGALTIFSPRIVSGVALVLSGATVTRATGAWDETAYSSDPGAVGFRVRVVLSGAEVGVYGHGGWTSTSGLTLSGANFGDPHTIHASSGYLEMANAISGTAGGLDNLFPGEGGAVVSGVSGVTTNLSFKVSEASPQGNDGEVLVTVEDLTYESVTSGLFLMTNYLFTENAAAAGDEIAALGDVTAFKELRLIGVDENGLPVTVTGWLKSWGDGTDGGAGTGGGYLLSGSHAFEVNPVYLTDPSNSYPERYLLSGEAEIRFSSQISGAAAWATSGFAVGDRFITSGVSAAIDAGGPYTIRKVTASGVYLAPGAFAASTNVTDNSHLVFEIAGESR